MKNYQLELEKILKECIEKKISPNLLLHSCCAPCSSYVIEYLSEFFKITIFYYNPNIYPQKEYLKRMHEQKNFVKKLANQNVNFFEEKFDEFYFLNKIKGLESEPEGGKRCEKCFEIRMDKTVQFAKKNNFDYFTTTLSISPHKNSQILNELGYKLEKKYKVNYLYSDFKKKNGFKKSIELSKKYGFYRQNYCGCIFSFYMNRPQ